MNPTSEARSSSGRSGFRWRFPMRWVLNSSICALLAGGAAAQAQDFFYPLPRAPLVREVDQLPRLARDERIDLVEDLVIRGTSDAPEDGFGGIRDIDVDDQGRIYALDVDRMWIAVFDADGRFLRTVGRSGQGPGEFTTPRGIAVSGDFLWLSASTRDRLIVWRLDGTLVNELTIEDAYGGPALHVEPVGDGTVAAVRLRVQESGETQVFFRVAPSGETLNTYSTIPSPPMTRLVAGGVHVMLPTGAAAPQIATDPSRARLYLTPAARYQIAAIGLGGTLAWGLASSSPPQPPDAADKQRVLDSLRPSVPDIREDDIQWPDRPALSRLRTDGRGNLYVFEYVSQWGDAAAARAVDVYRPDGELLHQAIFTAEPWLAAKGDFVYSVRENPKSGAYEIVRSRLVLP